MAAQNGDDDYGKSWDYRVFSEIDSEPDTPNSGRRRLHIRMVWYRGGRSISRPVPGDIFAIDHERSFPEGETAEALMLDLERMSAAVDRPVLYLAEWRQCLTRSGKAKQDG
jgi:hypothetical protein